MTRTERSREPLPVVFGSAASLRPIPGQLAFPAAGERNVFPAMESHHPDCDKLCDRYPGTARNRCWEDA